MKKSTLFFLFVTFSLLVQAKEDDTAFYRRPYYLGVNMGYNGFVMGVFKNYPTLMDAYHDPQSSHVNWFSTYGLMLAFPFARHGEMELALEGSYARGWLTEITEQHRDPVNPLHVVSVDQAIHHAHAGSLTTRLQLGYEVGRRNNYGFVIGGEMWYDLLGRRALTRYNAAGYALVLKTYIPASHGNAAVQLSGIIGNLLTARLYFGVRAGFCLRGTRVYRHKPKKYYVHAYEEGE